MPSRRNTPPPGRPEAGIAYGSLVQAGVSPVSQWDDELSLAAKRHFASEARGRCFVIGVGMTKFSRPGKQPADYPEMAAAAATEALRHAGVEYGAVGAAVCGSVYSDSTAGQACVYQLGMTGIPVLNVNNNCATGSTALWTARQLCQAGEGCVLALGFEKTPGGLQTMFTDREHPAARHLAAMAQAGVPGPSDKSRLPKMTQAVLNVYAQAAKRHMEKHGTTLEQFARVSHKNHRHSINNPNAQIRAPLSVQDVLSSPVLAPPLTAAMAAPLGDGAAAVVLCSHKFLQAHPELRAGAVEIVAQAMTSDTARTFDPADSDACVANLCGYDLSERAAKQVYALAGVGPEAVDVFEIHDAFASNELATYEALGLCAPGGGGELIDGASWEPNKAGAELCRMGRRRQWVVNPSGGLESKGHPVGATGLAQCAELVWQLRGEAGKRQVDGASVALQHNYGWASAAVVTLYRKVSDLAPARL